VAKRKGRGAAPNQKRRAESSRPTRQAATIPQRVWNELKVYGIPIGAVTSLLGILYLPRWINVSLVILTAGIVFAIRADTTVPIVKILRSKGGFRAYLYFASFLLAVGLIGTATFILGRQIGHTSGVREVLQDLDLPTRPLPPPRPRFPGDLNLDEYCRSEGPYQIMVPGPASLSVTVEGETITVPFPDDLRRAAEKKYGHNYLICGTRLRHPTPGAAEIEQVAFHVDKACAWQYPGQKVKAIAPKDRRQIDQWRCHLTSGPPATWP